MANLRQFLRPRENPNKVRFIGVMESGVLVDEMADVVQTQVIVQKAKASIRNRAGVPVLYQLEEDAPPVYREEALLETGLAKPPGTQSRYVLEDAQNLHSGYSSGTVDTGGFSLESKHLGMIALGVSIVIFVIFGWLTSINLAPAPVGEDGNDRANDRTDTEGTSGEQTLSGEANSHGLVEEPPAEIAADQGADARPAGTGAPAVPDGGGSSGTVPADAVAPGTGRDGPENP